MTTPVWLASYPKPGNTWLRVLLANLMQAGPIDLNTLQTADWTAGGRAPFDDLLLIASTLLTPDEADALRPSVYAALAESAGAGPTTAFVKVHDAYLPTPMGEAMLARGARAAILIVRDPRDVTASMAHHSRVTLDQAIAILNDPAGGICLDDNGVSLQFRQRLLDWSGHAASWLNQRDLPVHLVRYEDLLADTVAVFTEALAFVGETVDRARVEQAVERSSFAALQARERAAGFRERAWPGDPSAAPFFRKGLAGEWRTTLTRDQLLCIERAHGPMMRRLGYVLAHADSVA
ncbi:MAG: sulfotransferase domain-containing protein [Proteobacteria bacterium]|nr:sulfotransferase domain-containing protein [Pseudomonadota bacterium]